MVALDRFAYSQSSLQDFVDCRRRFQLRYIQRIAWPAVQAEPARENERHMQRGERFHRLIQQYLLGLPEDLLTRTAGADEDENLLRWWQNFLDEIPGTLDGARHVEIGLEAPLGGARVFAQYDLVVVRVDGSAVIYDWKTGARRPSRSSLLERMQTRVYPYLMVQAGAALNGGRAFLPEQVSMVYWFAEPGQAPERMAYDARRFQADEAALSALIASIHDLPPDEFVMSASEKPCRYCVYRSLCSRGGRAGDLTADPSYEADFPGDMDIDLSQIGEIEF